MTLAFFSRRYAGLALSLAALVASATASAQGFFTGTVRDTHGAPLSGVTVTAGHVQNAGIGYDYAIDGLALTDAFGNYSIDTLNQSATTQFILAAHTPGYVFTVWPARQCFDVTCIALTSNTSLPAYSTADFSLQAAGHVAGTVTLAGSGAAFTNGHISVYTDSLGGVQVPIAEDGSYLSQDLIPGTYTVEATVLAGALSQRYALHDLDSTRSPPGDAVNVPEGGTASAVDFTLDHGATFSGVLTSTVNGAPVSASVSVQRVGDGTNGNFSVTGSGGPGAYQSSLLAPGTFYVQFSRNDDYLPLFYAQQPSQDLAQTITLSEGQQLTGIDAQLTPLRSFAGTVTDATTQQPLAGAVVHAGTSPDIDTILSDVSDAVTDASGNYLLQGLDQGVSYYLWVDQAPGYVYQFYPNTLRCCQTPQIIGAVAQVLGANEQASGLNFALQPGAVVSGRVYDPDTGGGGEGAIVRVFAPFGGEVTPVNRFGYPDAPLADALGNYTTSAFLLYGNIYYLKLEIGSRVYLYPNVSCVLSLGCDITQGQPISFPSPGEYPNMDFVIQGLDKVFSGSFEDRLFLGNFDQ